MAAKTVVLVEGVSDRVAVEVLARRHGIDLAATGTVVVPMHGITNIGHFLTRHGDAARIAGLYDEAEERFVVSGLERTGRAGAGHGGRAPSGDERAWLESLGFFCCRAGLEDELIRALGPETVEGLVAAEGQLRSFRTLQKQPALRSRNLHDQLRRLMSGRSGGKERYAALMAETVDLDLVPRPLAQLLAWAARAE